MRFNRVHSMIRSAACAHRPACATRKYKRGGAPSLVALNNLRRHFDVQEPNRFWVTDITYIRMYEGWLYLP
jgi:putative transposase